jgi:hypothetical protein
VGRGLILHRAIPAWARRLRVRPPPILAGGQVISEDLGIKLENVTLDGSWVIVERASCIMVVSAAQRRCRPSYS